MINEDIKNIEDTKGDIKSRKSKTIKWSKEKGQTMIYKTLHRN